VSVPPGENFILYVRKSRADLTPESKAPTDLKLRAPVAIPTFYPNSDSIGGAMPVMLDAGEVREGIDITLARSPSYCIDGELPARSTNGLYFFVSEIEPDFGVTSEGGVIGFPPSGRFGANGKFRICELHAGEYEFTVVERPKDYRNPPAFFAKTQFSIRDRDVHAVQVVPSSPPLTVQGEVVVEGTPPTTLGQAELAFWPRPVNRVNYGPEGVGVSSSIPGTFAISGILDDSYDLKIFGVPKGCYLKDVTYGSASVLHEEFRPHSTLGNARIHVVLGTDGGIVTVHVVSKKGEPISDRSVVLVPAIADSESSVAGALISGLTDQDGTYSTTQISPGKYYVITTPLSIRPTLEVVSVVWQARTHADTIELGKNGQVSITLTSEAE
jgi:hypothetical protein